MLIHYFPGKLLYMYMYSFLLCVLLLGTSEISKNIYFMYSIYLYSMKIVIMNCNFIFIMVVVSIIIIYWLYKTFGAICGHSLKYKNVFKTDLKI